MEEEQHAKRGPLGNFLQLSRPPRMRNGKLAREKGRATAAAESSIEEI